MVCMSLAFALPYVVTSILSPWRNVTIAFFQSGVLPGLNLTLRHLPDIIMVLTSFTLTLYTCSIAFLISVLLALLSTSNTYLLKGSIIEPFSEWSKLFNILKSLLHSEK